MEIIKKIFSLILGTICASLTVFLIALILSVKTGKGISFENNGRYQSFSISLNNWTRKWVFGDFPNFDNIDENIKHKNLDHYHNLSHNEQIVYNAVLTRSKEILDNQTNSTSIRIPIKDFEINELNKKDNINEIERKINATISDIDFENIYKTLHNDYEYMMWWEFNASWIFSEADVVYDNGDLKNSSFELTLTPASCFKETSHSIKQTRIDEAIKALEKAKEIVNENPYDNWNDSFDYFKDKVDNLASYDNKAANKLLKGETDKDIIKSRTYINVFDDNDDTNVICVGFANAFQLLCDLSECDAICYKKEGIINLGEEDTNHTWNVVENNGEYYLVDITNMKFLSKFLKGELFLEQVDNPDNLLVNVEGTNISYSSSY